MENEVNIIEVYEKLVNHKKLIIGIVSVFTSIALILAFIITPIYRVEVLLAPASNDGASNSLSALASQFGGLASVAGISIGSEFANKDEAIATLNSRAFTEKFIEDNQLLPILFNDKWDNKNKQWDVSDAPTLWDGYSLFDTDIRKIFEDKNTGLITLSIDWRDKNEAEKWAMELVRRINNYMREKAINDSMKSLEYLNKELKKTRVVELQKVIYNLIESQVNVLMLANIRKEYSFKIIDPASAPDDDAFIKPRRSLIIVLGLILGIFFGVFVAAIIEYIASQKMIKYKS